MDDFENTDQSTAESLGTESEGYTFTTDDSSESDSPKINPAWEETLSKIPEEFHPALTPTFSEWDKNFQKVQQDFSPYKEFADNQIAPDRIQQAMQIADLLENNPRGVYDFLNTTYNYSGQAVEPDRASEDDDTFNYDENQDLEKHPKFQEMNQKIQNFENFFSKQQEEQTAARVQQEIEKDFNSIAEKYSGGNLDEQTKIDIARLAMGAGDNDLQKAADDYFTRFRTPARASDSAPPVIRGNGRTSKGISLQDVANMDSEERVKHVAAMMQSIVESN